MQDFRGFEARSWQISEQGRRLPFRSSQFVDSLTCGEGVPVTLDECEKSANVGEFPGADQSTIANRAYHSSTHIKRLGDLASICPWVGGILLSRASCTHMEADLFTAVMVLRMGYLAVLG